MVGGVFPPFPAPHGSGGSGGRLLRGQARDQPWFRVPLVQRRGRGTPAPAWFCPFLKAIPTFHPSGWEEEDGGRKALAGQCAGAQRWWRSSGWTQLSPCPSPAELLGPDTPEGGIFTPPLKQFSIIACSARALRPRQVSKLWGARR